MDALLEKYNYENYTYGDKNKYLEPLYYTINSIKWHNFGGWQLLMKLNHYLLYDSSVSVLGIYSREKKIYVHKSLRMFTAA
jgi:hypothetical protein